MHLHGLTCPIANAKGQGCGLVGVEGGCLEEFSPGGGSTAVVMPLRALMAMVVRWMVVMGGHGLALLGNAKGGDRPANQ